MTEQKQILGENRRWVPPIRQMLANFSEVEY